MKSYVKLKETFSKTISLSIQVYGNDCLIYTQFSDWFKDDRKSIEN